VQWASSGNRERASFAKAESGHSNVTHQREKNGEYGFAPGLFTANGRTPQTYSEKEKWIRDI